MGLFFRKNRKPRSKGQALLELALTLPVFMILLVGVVEIARLIFFYSSIFTASREAARYATGSGIGSGGVTYYRDCTGIRDRAVKTGIGVGLTNGDIVIAYDHGPDSNGEVVSIGTCPIVPDLVLGDRVTVTITKTFEPILPILKMGDIPISSTTSRTVLLKLDILSTPPYTNTPKKTLTGTTTSTTTPTITLTPTPLYTDTPTFTATSTSTRTVTPTRTNSPTVTLTPTITETPTITLTPTITSTRTITLTPTQTLTPTITSTKTNTPTVTPTPTFTNTPTKTSTATSTSTSTATATGTSTPTQPATCNQFTFTTPPTRNGLIWSIRINNTSNNTITLSQIDISWGGTALLKQVALASTVVWSDPVGLTSPRSLVFTVNPTISKKSNKMLNVTFTTTDYDPTWVKVYLTNGCYIQWVKP